MEFEELVQTLVAEHGQIIEGLEDVRDAANGRDFERASSSLIQVERVFRQHIADEESQILRLLIGTFGVKGAAEEIKVFQQHRPIYKLMEGLSNLASMTPKELEDNQSSLMALLREHTKAEEGSVFPKALDCYSRKTR